MLIPELNTMYKQLTSEERHYIAIQLKQLTSKNAIAKQLGRSHTTIIREIARNTGGNGYRYRQAHVFATQRHKGKNKAFKLTDEIKKIVAKHLKLDWSPEQICGRLRKDNAISLHHETVYRYILKNKHRGGKLYKHLRHRGKAYRRRYGYPHNRTGIPNRVDIDQRPWAVNKRLVFGHWEADTIIGKARQGAIVTLDERVTKLRLAYPVESRHMNNVSAAIIRLLKPLGRVVDSITYDNGKEFTPQGGIEQNAAHQKVNKIIGCMSYFAKPYHSWERGQNENANGLLRQYFPKKKSLKDVSYVRVKVATDKLNSRPRKCLGYKTPFEVFYNMTGIDASQLEVLHL